VEQAVWSSPVGAVTDVIETPDAFYVAKVEEKKIGRIIPFDEERAQQAIREKLRGEQFRVMWTKVQEDLRKQAIIRTDENMMNVAVEMAMENYPIWSQREPVRQ
jgi:parvulin-like peptidyl-prolyl isomerase